VFEYSGRDKMTKSYVHDNVIGKFSASHYL